MLVAALVLLGNVLIWTLPGPGLPGSGTS